MHQNQEETQINEENIHVSSISLYVYMKMGINYVDFYLRAGKKRMLKSIIFLLDCFQILSYSQLTQMQLSYKDREKPRK